MAKSNLNGIRADAYWEMLLAVKILEHELRNSRKFTRDEFGNFAGVVHPTNMMPLISAIGHAHSQLRDIVDRSARTK